MNKYRFTTLLAVIVALLVSAPLISQAAGQAVNSESIYIPIIRTAQSKSIFGTELSQNQFSSLIPKISESGIYWVRRNGLLWSFVQPNNASEWNWQNVSALETDLAQSTSSGAQVVLVIRSTPQWAQKYFGYLCGPMAQDKITDFANFVKEAVKRYSNPPFNVNYFEIWNEPDAAPSQVIGDSEFGCWGDLSDPYFGGGYYADMLKQVYPAVKSANPNAQLLIGGLLLDCDPTNAGTPGRCQQGYDLAPKFFQGILANGGGAYFDLVNFHGYPSYTAAGNPISSEKSFANWQARGGVVDGKVSYLRDVMASYGINKPIFQSEAALLLPPTSTGAATFEQAKADYLVWLFARNFSQGIVGTTWFTMDGPGWKSSGLFDSNQQPLPAYQALKFAVKELDRRTYSATVNSIPGVTGFQFNKGPAILWILFSQDDSAYTFPVPAGFTAAYDVLGDPVVPNNGMLTVEHPLYVEMTP